SSATAKVLNPESILAEGPVCTYAFSLGGKALTVIENDGTVRVWDVATSKKVRQFHLPVGEDEKHCEKLDHMLCIAADGNSLAVVTPDWREVQLWDLAAGKQTGSITGHDGERFHVSFAPDGKSLVSVGEDQAMRIWDAVHAKERACFRGKEREHC